jgi:hypothetical protein
LILGRVIKSIEYVTQNKERAEQFLTRRITQITPVKTLVKGDPANKVEMNKDVYCLSYILSLKKTELLNMLRISEKTKG